jgi:hypothetical protein
MEPERRRGRATARGIALVLALSAGLQAREAVAQTATLAESLFRDARVAMKDGDPERACPLFAESYRLDPAHGTLFNLAACEEARGRLASAWADFRKLVDVAPPEDERVLEATARLRTLEDRVPRLRLVLSAPLPPGHALELDGVALGSGALAGLLRVDPGKHTLRVIAGSEPVRTIELEVAVGQTLTHELEPIGAPRPAEANVVRDDAPPPRRPLRSHTPARSKLAAYTAFGFGATGVGASLVLGALALQAQRATEDHCPDRLCDREGMAAAERGGKYASLATATAVAGLVGLGAGAFLLVRAGDGVEVGLSGTEVRLEGTF